MINFQNKKLNNWSEYIEQKFQDNNYFEIDNSNERFTLIKSKTNNTKIWFYELTDDKLMITDCQYGNDDVKGWSGELLYGNIDKYGTFNFENVTYIDEELNIPIYKGWFSEDFYLGNNLIKSTSYKDENRKNIILSSYNSFSGCFFLFFYPVTKSLEILSRKLKITKLKYVEPVIK